MHSCVAQPQDGVGREQAKLLHVYIRMKNVESSVVKKLASISCQGRFNLCITGCQRVLLRGQFGDKRIINNYLNYFWKEIH